MRVLLDTAVAKRFPALTMAYAIVDGVEVGPSSSAAATGLRQAAEAHARGERTLDSLKDQKLFRIYRDFYWSIDIDPTKTRPSGEALNRRVLRGGPLPSINSFVDSYNAASLATGVSIGAYDADRLVGDLVLREGRAGEPFRGIGQQESRALTGGELVLADEEKVVNFYPYRDSDATKIGPKTTRAVVVACGVPKLPPKKLEDAVALATRNVTQACGGDAESPRLAEVG